MKLSTLMSLLVVGTIVMGAGVTAASADDLEGVKCPVSGKDVDEGATAEYKGGKVYFCCNGCPKAFAKSTAKFATKANHQLALTNQYDQENCPISGREAKDGTELEVAGVEISFCCKNCRKKVADASGDEQLALVRDRALVDADKDFDLMVYPGGVHVFTGRDDAHASKQRTSYFLRHLKPEQETD